MSHARPTSIKSLEDVDGHKGDCVKPAVGPFTPEVEPPKVHESESAPRALQANVVARDMSKRQPLITRGSRECLAN